MMTVNELFPAKCFAVNRRIIFTEPIKKTRVHMLHLSLKREEKQVEPGGEQTVELANQNACPVSDTSVCLQGDFHKRWHQTLP